MEVGEIIRLIESGKETWNKWKKANRGIRVRLEGIDFRGRDLSGFLFTDMGLVKVNFEGSNLEDAHFGKSALFASNFSKCNLKNCHFIEAKLHNTFFIESNL